jgi:hypothetical protein
VASADGASLRAAFELLKGKYPMVQLAEGVRA